MSTSHELSAAHEDVGEVRALEDKPILESIKVDERGKGDANFTDEYDPCKFKQILENYSNPIEPDYLLECLPSNLRPSSEGEGGDGKSNDPQHKSLENAIFTVPSVIPPTATPLLHDLAQQMIQAGHELQLLKSYRDTRAAVLEQSLKKLGVERFSDDDFQSMQWEVLDSKIRTWIHYMRISVKLLFVAEKKICDQILDGVDQFLRDKCFGEVTANSVAVLLSFGEAMAKRKRSPEQLFVVLDMYDIMRELQPEFELIFGSKPCTGIKEDALNLKKLLAQTVLNIIADFGLAVEMDDTKVHVMDGSVHNLTSYVETYVRFMIDYKSTLMQIFQEYNNRKHPDTELKSTITGYIIALRTNLDGKAKVYDDAALTQIFLMNNVHYVVGCVRRSQVMDLLGDGWVRPHQIIVQQHAHEYKRVSCDKILKCLTVPSGRSSIDNETTIASLVKAKLSLLGRKEKEKFKTFNSQFEELHQRQCQWRVPDTELRESLRLFISEVLLPAYRSFLEYYGPMIESGKIPQNCIKFTPEDLERMVNDFFQGKKLE